MRAPRPSSVGQRLCADAHHITLVTCECTLPVFSRLTAAGEAIALQATGEAHIGVDPRCFLNGAQAPGAPHGSCMAQRNHVDAQPLIQGVKRLIAWCVSEGYSGDIGML